MNKIITRIILIFLFGAIIYFALKLYCEHSRIDQSKFYGNSFQTVIQKLGPPDSILPKNYYSVQMGEDWNPVVVLSYKKWNVKFFLDESGKVIGILPIK